MSTNIQDVSFNAETTLAMGEAFDRACALLHNFGMAATVREIISKRIVEVAKNGETDPIRLYEQALKEFGLEEGQDRVAA